MGRQWLMLRAGLAMLVSAQAAIPRGNELCVPCIYDNALIPG